MKLDNVFGVIDTLVTIAVTIFWALMLLGKLDDTQITKLAMSIALYAFCVCIRIYYFLRRKLRD